MIEITCNNMITIKDLLNKIKWDKNLNPRDFSIYYLDRISKTLKRIKYPDIKKIEGNFIILEREGEETSIPLHRIRRVQQKGKVIWKR